MWVLWSNFINPKWKTKFWWDPEDTDKFVRRVEHENKEWQVPLEWDLKIWTYKNITYTINRDWIVKSKNWEDTHEIRPQIKGGKCYVALRSYDWKNRNIKTISVLTLMDKKFWKYFPWYSKKCKKPSKYKLVPKDWDYTNLKYNNLEYVDIYKYTKIWIVRTLLKWWIEDNIIINWCEISKNKLRKIRNDMQKEWYEDLIKGLWIKISFEDYKTIVYNKHLSNKEISEKTGINEQVINKYQI